MKKNCTCIRITLLIILLSQWALVVSPTEWTDGPYSSACKSMDGSVKIAQDQSTAVPLPSGHISLKTSKVFA